MTTWSLCHKLMTALSFMHLAAAQFKQILWMLIDAAAEWKFYPETHIDWSSIIAPVSHLMDILEEYANKVLGLFHSEWKLTSLCQGASFLSYYIHGQGWCSLNWFSCPRFDIFITL